MVLIEMALKNWRIYQGQYSLMRNVRILEWTLMVESLLQILTKRRSQTFYKPANIHSVANTTAESISSNNHLEYCQ